MGSVAEGAGGGRGGDSGGDGEGEGDVGGAEGGEGGERGEGHHGVGIGTGIATGTGNRRAKRAYLRVTARDGDDKSPGGGGCWYYRLRMCVRPPPISPSPRMLANV